MLSFSISVIYPPSQRGRKPHAPPSPNLFPPLSPTHTPSSPSLLSPSVAGRSSLLVHVSSAAGARSGEGTCSGRRRWWWHLSLSLSLSLSLFPSVFLSSRLSFLPRIRPYVNRCRLHGCKGKMARCSELSFMRVHAVSNGLGACMGCRAQGKRGKGR